MSPPFRVIILQKHVKSFDKKELEAIRRGAFGKNNIIILTRQKVS